MSKKIKIIIISILMIFFLLAYKIYINMNNTIESSNKEEILKINIIDKYNKLEELYNNPQAENYVEVDISIDGNYYSNVGIRTKGSAIYNFLKRYNSTKHSFKVKLDYLNKDQQYKGMTEISLNTHVMDPTAIREYLVYELYNEMGVNTNHYCLGDFYINGRNMGLVTLVEVINEGYAFRAYNSENGNLYKPKTENSRTLCGSQLKYVDDEIETYSDVLNNVETEKTDEEDKKRLISIIKKLNDTNNKEQIESCFIDFNKVIKMVAINKAISNVDSFNGKTLRNFYIYEEDGKIDIIPFDFNISLGLKHEIISWTNQYIYDLKFEEYHSNIHSQIVEIIVENEEYMEIYRNYLKEIFDKMQEIQTEKKIDEISLKVDEIIKKDTNNFYTYEQYLEGIEELKQYLRRRAIQVMEM